MTVRECAIIEAYTGICMLTGAKTKYMYQYAEEKLGHPVYTHFFASDTFRLELKMKSKDDFIQLCKESMEVW